MKTDEELKQLAKDIMADKVFTDAHLEEHEDVCMVFMALALMSKKDKEALEKGGKPFRIYEYLSKAGPRSVNGRPCFLSFRILYEEEWKTVHKYMKEVKKAMDAI